MSKIIELIHELCPEGVPRMPLASLFAIRTGDRPKEIYKDRSAGLFPYMNGGVSESGFTTTFNYDPETITIPSRGSVGIVSIASERFHLGPLCYGLVPVNQKAFLAAFGFHYLKQIQMEIISLQQSGSIPALNKKQLETVVLPVPPLEVQKEIVSILDKFTQLEAELEAELEARRTQYEVTRDRLLDFSSDLDRHPLGEMIRELGLDAVPEALVSDFVQYSEVRVSSNQLSPENYVGVEQLLQNRMGRVEATKIAQNLTLSAFKPGDVLLGNIRPYLRKIWHADIHGGCGGDVLVLSVPAANQDLVNSRYLFHVLSSERFFEYNVQHSKGAKMPRGSKKAIMNFQFWLPPLIIQARIVTILDKFDALVNDITIGLPAEIAARRKQYGYYRNKLLTFKELDAA